MSHPVCPYCNSEDIVVDANAQWNKEAEEFQLVGTHDGGGCETCQETFKRPNWVD